MKKKKINYGEIIQKSIDLMNQNIKFDWKNFAFLFILIPILFGILVTYIGTEAPDLFASSYISERGDDVIPDRHGYAENLPFGDAITEFLPAMIRIILSLVGLAITAMVIYAGILFVINFGNDEKLTKAKTMLMWSLMGLAFIVFSYAIVYAITNISWDKK